MHFKIVVCCAKSESPLEENISLPFIGAWSNRVRAAVARSSALSHRRAGGRCGAHIVRESWTRNCCGWASALRTVLAGRTTPSVLFAVAVLLTCRRIRRHENGGCSARSLFRDADASNYTLCVCVVFAAVRRPTSIAKPWSTRTCRHVVRFNTIEANC